MSKSRVETYGVLRALLTLAVVVGHCTYYRISTRYGGIDLFAAMAQAGVQDTVVHRIVSLITSIIYTFHMPMFFALSGALFEFGDQKPFRVLIQSKAKRLLIPFLAVTTIASVPLKWLAGYWSGSANLARDIIVGQYLVQGNSHLWFLPTLFLEFVFFHCFRKWEVRRGVNQVVSLIIFLGLNLIAYKIPYQLLSYFANYLLWFYAGMIFERQRTRLERHCGWASLILSLACWIAIYNLRGRFAGGGVLGRLYDRSIPVLYTTAGIVCFYTLCSMLSKTRFKDMGFIRLLERHSFGIYLYSDSLNYVILSAFVGLFSISALGSEFGAAALYILRLSISLGVSMLASIAIKKLNIRYIA